MIEGGGVRGGRYRLAILALQRRNVALRLAQRALLRLRARGCRSARRAVGGAGKVQACIPWLPSSFRAQLYPLCTSQSTLQMHLESLGWERGRARDLRRGVLHGERGHEAALLLVDPLP